MSVDVYLLDSNWVFETKFDPKTNNFGQASRKVLGAVPGNAIMVVVAPGDDMGSAVRKVQTALGNQKLGVLNIGSHGDPQYVKIGKGLQLDNAGEFGALAGNFDPIKRLIRIFGCGVASDTPLRPDPQVAQYSKFAIDFGMLGSWNPTFNSADNGYQLLKALANVTQASVQAAINVTSNVLGDYFKYLSVPTVWVYPDSARDQKEFVHDGGWFHKSYMVKHNDFIRLDYNAAGDVIK